MLYSIYASIINLHSMIAKVYFTIIFISYFEYDLFSLINSVNLFNRATQFILDCHVISINSYHRSLMTAILRIINIKFSQSVGKIRILLLDMFYIRKLY